MAVDGTTPQARTDQKKQPSPPHLRVGAKRRGAGRAATSGSDRGPGEHMDRRRAVRTLDEDPPPAEDRRTGFGDQDPFKELY